MTAQFFASVLISIKYIDTFYFTFSLHLYMASFQSIVKQLENLNKNLYAKFIEKNTIDLMVKNLIKCYLRTERQIKLYNSFYHWKINLDLFFNFAAITLNIFFLY